MSMVVLIEKMIIPLIKSETMKLTRGALETMKLMRSALETLIMQWKCIIWIQIMTETESMGQGKCSGTTFIMLFISELNFLCEIVWMIR
jgi:hypothetical protein